MVLLKNSLLVFLGCLQQAINLNQCTEDKSLQHPVDWHRQQSEHMSASIPFFAHAAQSKHTVLPNKTGQPVTKTS